MDRFTRKCLVDRKIVQELIAKSSFNNISQKLKVGKRRIKKIYKLAKDFGYLDGTPMPEYPKGIFNYETEQNLPTSKTDELLLEHLTWIKERREVGWHLITIFEELPIKVGQSSFYRFIKRHKIDQDRERSRCRVKVVSEIINEPGEALYLDWGKLRDIIDPLTGKKRTIWFLAGVMGFSRYMMVRIVFDNKTETTLCAIESMINEMGGSPHRLISDNPKCFTLEASKFEPILNPAFERFCEHYNSIPEMLPPRDPKKKGKVERIVPYVRRLFESFSEWTTLEAAQDFMDSKVKIANQRTHGTTKLRPVDVFLEKEGSELHILPSTSFELETYHEGKVRRDGHVRFQNKYYSVDKEFYDKKVFIIGTKNIVKIYHRGELLETHNKVTNKFQSKSTKTHHLEPYEQIIKDGKIYLEKAKKIGPSTTELIEAILLKGRGFIDTRKIWGILSLDKSYPLEKIDQACKYALELEELSYRVVEAELRRREPETKNIATSKRNNKYTRSMSEYLQ